MPKRKKSRVRKHKRQRQRFPFSISFGLIILLAVIVIAIAFFLFSSNQKLQNRYITTIHQSFPLSLRAKYTPLISPYPSSTVTPSPVPLSGYCLHVPVLMYHYIQPEALAKELGQTALTVDSGVFDQHMAYLAAHGYTSIWANELINALLTHSPLPAKPVVVTMDDGYADNDIYALPVLQKYGIKANIAIVSGLMGGNSDMLSWEQVNQLKGSGLVYFTNHTWSHYAITSGSQSKIESEIDTAQQQIQQYTGQSVNVFTYPYGAINNNAIQTLQQKGYLGAFSEIPGQWQCDSFIMTLHRTRIGNSSLSSYGL